MPMPMLLPLLLLLLCHSIATAYEYCIQVKSTTEKLWEAHTPQKCALCWDRTLNSDFEAHCDQQQQQKTATKSQSLLNDDDKSVHCHKKPIIPLSLREIRRFDCWPKSRNYFFDFVAAMCVCTCVPASVQFAFSLFSLYSIFSTPFSIGLRTDRQVW